MAHRKHHHRRKSHPRRNPKRSKRTGRFIRR